MRTADLGVWQIEVNLVCNEVWLCEEIELFKVVWHTSVSESPGRDPRRIRGGGYGESTARSVREPTRPNDSGVRKCFSLPECKIFSEFVHPAETQGLQLDCGLCPAPPRSVVLGEPI